jgi:hypothetical protein
MSAVAPGMFWVSLIAKPMCKFLLKHPFICFILISSIYLYVAQRCLRSAWEHNYGKTATNDEIGARWQQHMSYTRKN